MRRAGRILMNWRAESHRNGEPGGRWAFKPTGNKAGIKGLTCCLTLRRCLYLSLHVFMQNTEEAIGMALESRMGRGADESLQPARDRGSHTHPNPLLLCPTECFQLPFRRSSWKACSQVPGVGLKAVHPEDAQGVAHSLDDSTESHTVPQNQARLTLRCHR